MPDINQAANTIIITRPKSDADKLADDLTKKGYNCIIEPMLSVHTLFENAKQLEYALDRKPQAIIATSKHAIAAFALMAEMRHIPVIAVGEATAHRALNLGFENVSFAHGTAHSLVAHVSNNYSPAGGTLLYARGVDISTDVATRLMQNDFSVDSAILYQAKPTRELSKALREAVLDNQVDSILFFSQNTVRTYAKLAKENDIAEAHENITALCMSRNIADKARSLLVWKDVMLFSKDMKNIL